MAVMSRIPVALYPDNIQQWIETNGPWIKQAIDKHNAWLEEAGIAKYQKAYDGKIQSVDEREKSRGDDINHKLLPNYAMLVIDTIVDYMMGKAPIYTVDATAVKEEGATADQVTMDAYREEILQLLVTEDARRVISEMLRQGSIAGYSAVITWVDEEGVIDFEEFPVQEVVPIFDVRGRYRMALRYYHVETYEEGNDQPVIRTKVEVYDKQYVGYFIGDETGTAYSVDQDEVATGNPAAHKAGRIPVSVYTNGTAADYEERKQRAGVSDLANGVYTLLEQFAHVMSDKANTVDRLLDQYLKFVGADMDENEVLMMRKARAIALKGDIKTSDAEFIAPSQDDQAVENHLNRLRDLIHDMTFTPRLNELSGATATEIKVKYAAIDIRTGKKENYLIPALKHFVGVLTDMINARRLVDAGANEEDIHDILTGKKTTSVKLYNADWLQITLNRNMPQNYQEIANIVKLLTGIVPDSYLYELLWFVDDPVAALEEMKVQKQAALDANMAALGYGSGFTDTNNNNDPPAVE